MGDHRPVLGDLRGLYRPYSVSGFSFDDVNASPNRRRSGGASGASES